LQVCLKPAAIVAGNRIFHRLFLSGFLHADDMHLYYNMVSLLWKGVKLEGTMGSLRFGIMMAFLLFASHILVVASSFFVADTIGFPTLIHQCAVGFSAVLFGMKAVLNSSSPAFEYVGGVLLPTKYAAWGELVRCWLSRRVAVLVAPDCVGVDVIVVIVVVVVV
jgi:rhomboid domain-containing protein 1